MNSFLPLLYLTSKPFSAVTKIFFTCLLILAPSVKRERLFYVHHFGIFCFDYPYFLVFRRKNIYLLFENRYFFYFYSSLTSVLL